MIPYIFVSTLPKCKYYGPRSDQSFMIPYDQKKSLVHLDILYILYAADVKTDSIFRAKY